MDLYKAIQELKIEKLRLDRAIAALEGSLTVEEPQAKRQGWNAESRRAAAERMRKYWARRKQQAAKNTAGYSAIPPSTESD